MSYGGYQKTGYGTQGNEDGGGFVSGSQQGSQGGQKRNTDEYLRPVTIKQLVDAKASYSDSDIQIDGMPVTQVTVVGQVRAVNPQATNVTFKLDDGTGTIDVKKWLDAGKSSGEDEAARFPLDTYVRVLGRLQSFNGKIHIGAHHVRAIEDFNEVNYHLLEATYVHLLMTKGSATGGGKSGGYQDSDSMFVDQGNGYSGGGYGGGGGDDSRVSMCSPQAQRLYRWYQKAPGNTEGINIQDVVAGTKMSTTDVQRAADELLGHGLVYTTVDEETWAILEV